MGVGWIMGDFWIMGYFWIMCDFWSIGFFWSMGGHLIFFFLIWIITPFLMVGDF